MSDTLAVFDCEELDRREEEFLNELDELEDVTDMELLIACIAFDLAMDDCWE